MAGFHAGCANFHTPFGPPVSGGCGPVWHPTQPPPPLLGQPVAAGFPPVGVCGACNGSGVFGDVACGSGFGSGCAGCCGGPCGLADGGGYVAAAGIAPSSTALLGGPHPRGPQAWHPSAVEPRGAADGLPPVHSELRKLHAELHREETTAEHLRQQLLASQAQAAAEAAAAASQHQASGLVAPPPHSMLRMLQMPLEGPIPALAPHAVCGRVGGDPQMSVGPEARCLSSGALPWQGGMVGGQAVVHQPVQGILSPPPMAPPPRDITERHRQAAEDSKRLYLSGRLEGFEVLIPESVFVSNEPGRHAPVSSSSGAQPLTSRTLSDNHNGSRDSGASPNNEDVLRVRVLSAKKLQNRDSGVFGDVSDPYVVMRLGKREQKTATIANDLNPVWHTNNEFSFSVGVQDGTLELEVMDANKVFSDTSLGKINVALQKLEEGRWQRREEHLEDGRGGELTFEVFFQRAARDLEQPSEKDFVTAEVPVRDVLHLKILSARRLRLQDAGGNSGDASHVCTVARLGATERKTPLVSNDLNPVWDSGNTFSIPVGQRSDDLELDVRNVNNEDKSERSFGKLRVPVGGLHTDWQRRKERLEGSKKGELEFEVKVCGGQVEDPEEELDRLYAELKRRVARSVIPEPPPPPSIDPIVPPIRRGIDVGVQAMSPALSRTSTEYEPPSVLTPAEAAAAEASTGPWPSQPTASREDCGQPEIRVKL
eukprot:TRINITY_DN68561_c0_g1_i1.p1 TRINITY_DN68561_c0_g1~~TRINITY_DN68561_c0_g1_i1.p1  ORF type:complete len:710 (-),score=129.87 TRINITY_DN68561_c0_g1_i1:57-2186(-)